MKKLYYIIIALLVAVALLVLFARRTQAPSSLSSPLPSETVIVSGSPARTPTRTVTPTPVPGKLSYTQALQTYKGRLMQFDAACAATPATLTIKAGTVLMFDNRTAKPITFALDNAKYSVAAYDYRTLAVTAATFPKAVSVDCNARSNVGTINVQK